MRYLRMAVVMVLLIFVLALTTMATPLPTGTLLSIDQGYGSGTNTPCSVGSCFGWRDFFGTELWYNFGPGLDGGILVGINQASNGQQTYPANNYPGLISDAWSFYNLFGTFATDLMQGMNADGVYTVAYDTADQNIFDSMSCTGIDCISKTVLGTWHMVWNGNVTPLGSSLGCSAVFNQAYCLGVTEWSVIPNPPTQTSNSAYVLKYTWVVPDGDPSSWGNAPFSFILRGNIILPDICYGIECPMYQECNILTGICEGPDPCIGVVCTNNDPCKTSECDYLGICQLYNASNGRLCDDGNICTIDDHCMYGVCGGTDTCFVNVKIPNATLQDVQQYFPLAQPL